MSQPEPPAPGQPQPDPAQPYPPAPTAPYGQQPYPQAPQAPYGQGGAGQPPYGMAPPAYGQPPYGTAPTPRQPSRTTAIIALVLSVIGIFLIPALIAIGLSIKVILDARKGTAKGMGLAIAAIVISLVWIAVLIGIGATGGFSDRDENGQIKDDTTLSVFNLRPGDCFSDDNLAGIPTDAETGAETKDVGAAPCSTPHQFEVFHNETLPEGDYPGDASLQKQSESICAKEFAAYVGVPLRKSRYTFSYYYPEREGWETQDDRVISCLLADPKGKNLTGSLKGIAK